MAHRAKEPFVTASPDTGRGVMFNTDQVVPEWAAKRCPDLVYSDGAAKPRKAAKAASKD